MRAGSIAFLQYSRCRPLLMVYAIVAASLWPELGSKPGLRAALAQKQRQKAGKSGKPQGANHESSSQSAEDQIGFGEPAEVVAEKPLAPPSDWSVVGNLRSELALWALRFHGNPFAKARQSIDLGVRYKKGPFRVALGGHAEYDFAYLYKSEAYDGPTLDEYQGRLLPREAIIELSNGRFALTAGYQIVAWGPADYLPTLDVANPRDLREIGLTELENLRQPVLATRLGAFVGSHRFEAMMIHLPYFGLRSPPAGPYSNLTSIFPKEALFGKEYNHINPRFNQQFLLRWYYAGEWIDLALYAATVFDQQGILRINDMKTFLSNTAVDLDHTRYTLLGHSGALPIRSWLVKWEVAFELDRSFNTGPQPIGVVKLHRVNPMIGLSFTGIKNLNVALEVSKPWLLSERNAELLFPADKLFWVLRASYSMLRNRIELSAIGTIMGLRLEQGWMLRSEALFTVRDGLKLSAGYITYHPGDERGPLTGFTEHDRVYLGLHWSFQLL